MYPSPACEAVIRKYEECRLTAYLDDGRTGTWTIGWGHTGPDVYEGLVWTQEQADNALASDIHEHWAAVSSLVKVALTQGQCDALTDFTFNEGKQHLQQSTMLRLLNSGQYAQVPDCLYHEDADGAPHGWIYAFGKVNPRLIERRKDEITLWNS